MPNALRLRPTFASILAFLCLTLLLIEAHEQMHALSTRLLCGGWAERVFDNVLPYPGCSTTRLALVDIAAPLFSYLCVGLGAALMGRADRRTQAVGFALLFASLPLGRVLPQVVATFVAGTTADEYSFVRHLAGPALGRGAAGAGATAIALAATLPPLILAWRRLQPQGRPRLFAAFYGLPLLFAIAWLAIGNGLLANGILASLGTTAWPGLVAIHAVVVAAAFLFLCRRLVDAASADAHALPARSIRPVPESAR